MLDHILDLFQWFLLVVLTHGMLNSIFRLDVQQFLVEIIYIFKEMLKNKY